MGKDYWEEFIVRTNVRKSLEGEKTIRVPKKITTPLKAFGVDVQKTVESFLIELLIDLRKKRSD